jgi:TetR/AcrR family transcriptional regulator, tetracycline repressor protein
MGGDRAEDTSENQSVEVPSPPWVRTRKRRAAPRAPLSREAIVEAALRVVDREGLEGTSMRRVAEELGTAPSALYWHVRNKDELLQFVFDRVAGEIELPPLDPENWQEQAKTVAREMRRVLTSHRDIARVSLGAIPVGPNVLRVVEWMHALLREAGLPDRVVALVGDLFGLYVGAYAFEESLGLASPTGEDLPPEQIMAMLREYWESMPPGSFPHTLALLDLLFEGSPDERFEFGLDVMIRGLASLQDESAAPSG